MIVLGRQFFGKSFVNGLRHNCTRGSTSNLKQILLSMPKEKLHVVGMQKQRQKLKDKGRKYIPGTVTMQVLGSGARGAPRCLYLITDQSRYLFNCGEGTQRLAHEHKCKLSKLEHIFVTRPTWENMGGLPGIALTIQDVGVPHVTLHGPQGTDEIFDATKRFVILKDLTVSMAECMVTKPYDDNVMTVHYVPLIRQGQDLKCADNVSDSDESIDTSDDDEIDDTDYYAHEINRNGKRSRQEHEINKKLQRIDTKPKGKRITDTLAYICRLKSRPGTLSLKKCVEMGVTPGPLLGKLKMGYDVTLPNGNIVRGKDVCEPDEVGPIFIVVECPSKDYLDSLVKNPVFESYQSTATNDGDLAFCVVHFTPETIMQEPQYQDWMNKFSPSTNHLILNERNECLGSVAIHKIQHNLHLLHPNIFPFLNEQGFANGGSPKINPNCIEGNEDEIVDRLTSGSSQTNSNEDMKSNECDSTYLAKTLHTIHLRPKNGSDKSSELLLQPQEYLNETLALDGMLDALAELQTDISKKTKELEQKEYPKIVMLGTGSCIPNKIRNTSGILLRIDEDRSILLDCGEGTLGQIVRFFGKSEAYRVLAGIKAVYISHLHADHHIGLIGLLKGREWVTQEPLLLLAPKQISCWLHFYHRRFESILNNFVLVPNGSLTLNDHNLPSDMQSRLYDTLNASDISTVPVRHCPNSFGFSFTHADGYKITYSGDTMPCNTLVELGKGSDLLIHEATMEDALVDEARLKLHSTTSQAIEIGRKMGAKFTLLTHFSQRYAKLPRFQDGSFGQEVGIAFDNMQVRLSELPLLPLFYPSLHIMFAEFRDELEVRAIKREQRLLREKEAGMVNR